MDNSDLSNEATTGEVGDATANTPAPSPMVNSDDEYRRKHRRAEKKRRDVNSEKLRELALLLRVAEYANQGTEQQVLDLTCEAARTYMRIREICAEEERFRFPQTSTADGLAFPMVQQYNADQGAGRTSAPNFGAGPPMPVRLNDQLTHGLSTVPGPYAAVSSHLPGAPGQIWYGPQGQSVPFPDHNASIASHLSGAPDQPCFMPQVQRMAFPNHNDPFADRRSGPTR